MRSTLFYIPTEIAGLPLLGFGLLLGLWILVGVGTFFWNRQQKATAEEQWGLVPFWAIVAVAIVFVMPGLVESTTNHLGKVVPLGIPIRGFGVMMMLGTIFGVALAVYRGQQMGIHPDVIYSLAMWMFACGIIGARAFYLLQYHDQFEGDNLVEWVISLANVTRGGLVVYGALLGAVPAAFYFLWSKQLPLLAVIDVISPSMVVGLALGRLGCFLNGCCFGGYCESPWLAMTFPSESPPYTQHLDQGYASGVWLSPDKSTADNGSAQPIVTYVAPNSPAAKAGIKPGQSWKGALLNGQSIEDLAQARKALASSGPQFEIVIGKETFTWTAQIPSRSIPIHPTQLYAALDAALLALFLWVAYPFCRHDGQIFAALLICHAISRFCLELIRNDEAGQFGSGLTISQLFSLGIGIAGLGLLVFVTKNGAAKALPRPSTLASA